jgi:hypothetical protein
VETADDAAQTSLDWSVLRSSLEEHARPPPRSPLPAPPSLSAPTGSQTSPGKFAVSPPAPPASLVPPPGAGTVVAAGTDGAPTFPSSNVAVGGGGYVVLPLPAGEVLRFSEAAYLDAWMRATLPVRDAAVQAPNMPHVRQSSPDFLKALICFRVTQCPGSSGTPPVL